VISIISGDNVALLTGRILAAFGLPEDIKIRGGPACTDIPITRRGPIAIPNLGMMLPTECNVWINLRLMVHFASMIKLIG
jgi:hypothetical protein